jgi:hypothetical protein
MRKILSIASLFLLISFGTVLLRSQGTGTAGQYVYFNSANPITCTLGSFYFNTTLNQLFVCTGTNVLTAVGTLTGTSSSIGGGALLAGACSTTAVTVAGATTGMVAEVDPNTYPGDGSVWSAQVTSANTVTVKVCAIIALTPTASTYNVRVIQ